MDAGVEGITWLEAEVPHPYRLVFTNRRGGVSEAPYDTLNLGFKSGDDPSRVLENRLRVCGALGLDLDDWTLVRQVHSSRVMEVDGPALGAGSRDYASGLGEADAMVARECRAVLCILTADCVPVALYGGEPPAMALVHSGWKGTLAGIAGAAVEEMGRRFGTRPEELGATLGPGIRSCCYGVDDERAASFRQAFGETGTPPENGPRSLPGHPRHPGGEGDEAGDHRGHRHLHLLRPGLLLLPARRNHRAAGRPAVDGRGQRDGA